MMPNGSGSAFVPCNARAAASRLAAPAALPRVIFLMSSSV